MSTSRQLLAGEVNFSPRGFPQNGFEKAEQDVPRLKKNDVVLLLNELMKEDTAGDPMSAKKWTRRDTRSVSKDMKERGVEICPNSVAKLLKEEHYSLRVNRKTICETHHPDRDRQFKIISEEKKRFEDKGQPILSCDTKKKELIGNFKNQGKAWKKKDQAEQVLTHDFRSDALAIASPYGLFETLLNRGTVVVGTSSDTPAFAVDCVGG